MTLKSIAEAISGGRVKRRVFTKENKNALILIFPEEEREISYYYSLIKCMFQYSILPVATSAEPNSSLTYTSTSNSVISSIFPYLL